MLFPEDDHHYCQKFANEISSFFNNDREEEDSKKPIEDISYIDDQFFSFLQLQRRSEPQKKSESEPDDQFFSVLQLQRRSEAPSCEKTTSGVVTRSKTKIPEPKDVKPVIGAKRKIGKKPRKKNDSLNISDVWLSPEKDERNPMKLNELWTDEELPELCALLGDETAYDSPYVPYFDEFPNFDILEQYEPELKRKVPPSSHTGGKWKPVETGGKFRSLTPTESKCRSPLFEHSTTPVAKKRNHDDLITCTGCRKTVSNKNLAQHLISSYHFRRFCPDDPLHIQQVLSKIEDIAITCPFQCTICRFFCNTAEDLKNHWKNTPHIDGLSDSYFLCFPCGLRFDCSDDVLQHIGTKKHESDFPAVIKKRLNVRCEVCFLDFGLRVRLAKHVESAHHPPKNEASVRCNSCAWVGFSQKGLQIHIRRAHGDSLHFCTSCDLNFPSAKEALTHRGSSKHKQLYGKQEPEKKFQDSICLKCGLKFPNPQFLSHHTTIGCQFPKTRDEKMTYQCSTCCFGSEKKIDLLCHESQHANESNDLVTCPECRKVLLKKGLRAHLQSHTLEYAFTCHVCGKGFTKHARFSAHVAKHQNENKADVYKCKDCYYSTKISSHFKRHQLSHEELRSYECPHCDFKAKILEHLKRHLKTHSNIKPYKCPYCEYSCNLLENLRKHVVKTKAHKGRTLYECPWCTFGSNLGKNFDEHLTQHHREAYESKGKFQNWEIYRPRTESTAQVDE